MLQSCMYVCMELANWSNQADTSGALARWPQIKVAL
jgi:hypothetical protein